MRYRFRLWSWSAIGAVIDPNYKPSVTITRIYRWRWLARLHAFPYYFGPNMFGHACWPEIDEVACTVVNGQKIWEPVERYSTQLTRKPND